MRLHLYFTGKTTESYLKEGISNFTERLNHYIPSEIVVIPSSSSKIPSRIKEEEGESMLKKLENKDIVILLDENGKQFSSRELAAYIEGKMISGNHRMVFITGGAFGVSENVRKRADLVLSFSRLTFTHQMIRLLLSEQLYRAMTIIRKEGYHHD
jgi:23S rRNA (pseudouridine1915-N3)-methyltransferase